ncbi:cytochrome c oxidase subunit 3 [Granulicella tundricola]|uniref:Cytochrome c oxidase subunit III n=1 Tax=Granulicella tundricola (strain ATCC BAA-1859 / DSM 23138 / MP5ACTX9) TaxID=1198114 RepID=E8WWZ3_GRATM|nr:cytochrome c oxidase subunit 3 [Granulicella tundricola]ADW68554.1 cytochrome c oxidase subunit III [Granulicella tundricola MP5ACTX9]
MPAVITPNEIERKRRDLEDGDHGGGRRPPTDKRTGGGGDPDNWNDRRRGRRSPRERLDRYRLGLFFALSAVFMFFVAIVSVFFVSQGSGHFDANARFINEWLPTAIPPLLWLNTLVLVLSSITVEVARRHMFREMDVMDEWLGLGKPTSRRAMPWLVATVVLGCVFLVGQVVAWRQLGAEHVFYNSNPSSHSFFLITGIHGFHLVVGVLALFAALLGLGLSKVVENRQIMVDCAAWYWHSMGILWLGLFALLALFQ